MGPYGINPDYEDGPTWAPDESERIDKFIETMLKASPEYRKHMEVDLFRAYLEAHNLDQYSKLLVYSAFEIRDRLTGEAPPREEGEIVVRNIQNIPAAVAVMFYVTQQQASELLPRRRDVFYYAPQALEFQWMHVASSRMIELWEIPWPTMGAPNCAEDLKDTNVDTYFNVLCIYGRDDRRYWVSTEFNRWHHNFSRPEIIGERLQSQSKRSTYREVLAKVYDILLVFSMKECLSMT